jgi:tRNA U34 2-thiouridine synthase MnmA/TrmU
MKHKPKAIGLLSGGLDSMLATRIILDQGIEVLGLTFTTPFFGAEKAERAARQLQVPLTIRDITDPHWVMLKNPRYGYGKRMNPCIDCHALMLRKAGEEMEAIQADFLFTGEVLGQRPFSQTKNSLRAVEKTSGFADRILRPLSARLLAETVPERQGLVDRSRLLDIQGRSRKRQMALAEDFGIKDYPTPAGGCLLTDPVFSRRLKELLQHAPDPLRREIEFLKVGRHFRWRPEAKTIIGRNKKENDFIEERLLPNDGWARVLHVPGPLVIMPGWSGDEEDQTRMAGLVLAYSDAPEGQTVPVQLGCAESRWLLKLPKLSKEFFREWMI